MDRDPRYYHLYAVWEAVKAAGEEGCKFTLPAVAEMDDDCQIPVRITRNGKSKWMILKLSLEGVEP